MSEALQKTVPAITDGDPLLNIEQVCQQVKASERSVYRAIASKEFPKAMSLPGGKRWFQSEVNQYLREKRARRD